MGEKKSEWFYLYRRVSIHLQHASKQLQNTECKWRCTAHYSTHLGPCQHPCSSLSVIASTKHPGGLKTPAGFPSEPPSHFHALIHMHNFAQNALCEENWERSFFFLLPESVIINKIKNTKGTKKKKETSTSVLPCFMIISLKRPVRSWVR